jgi:hypothetical protein
MIEELLGKTIVDIRGDIGIELMTFKTLEGPKYAMYHFQDCCETVYLQDICGDLEDLLHTPVTLAEEVTSEDVSHKENQDARLRAVISSKPTMESVEATADSYTWTFYKIGTNKGSVTLRWFGESNGYYSEGVSFEEENQK